MKKDRMKEIITNVIDHIAICRNTSEQIEILANNFGFTEQELLEFNYSKADIETYYPDEIYYTD